MGAQNICGGSDRVGGREYTPLYEKGIKKAQNKSMKTAVFDMNTKQVLGI